MTFLQPHRREAIAQPLPPLTNKQFQNEPEKLIAFYYSLSAPERTAYFSSTTCIAKGYDVPRRTVQHWIDYGWIVAVKLGRNYKVYLPSVEEFLHRCADV